MRRITNGGTLWIPRPSLVVLIGPSGSGKSFLARRLFSPYEVVSSDACRAMISDSEDDQSVTPDAFELLRHIVRLRLAAGRLAVVDATNIHQSARRRNLDLAQEFGVDAIAIVLDVPAESCLAQNARRRGRVVPSRAILEQRRDLEAALPGLKAEGFSVIYRLDEKAMSDLLALES